MEEPGDYGIQHKESFVNSVLHAVKRRCRSLCTKKTVHKRLPIVKWLPRYTGQDALGDLVAGVTVGLTVIPQSLAYANVAGLPPQVNITKQLFHASLYLNEAHRWKFFTSYSFLFHSMDCTVASWAALFTLYLAPAKIFQWDRVPLHLCSPIKQFHTSTHP